MAHAELDNLFIIRGASKVKLIDFRCGEIMSRSPYKSYSGMHSIINLFYVKGFRKTTLH